MPLRPVRFSILGECQGCFTGDEFVAWLLENVPEFWRDLYIILVAARELTGCEGLLSEPGEFGNEFENVNDRTRSSISPQEQLGQALYSSTTLQSKLALEL